jgi:arsenate reductase
MAEGLVREFGAGLVEVYSAGFIAVAIHPQAVLVMQEIGIDISQQRSKRIDYAFMNTMDYVILLCTDSEGAVFCPPIPSHVAQLHWPIYDPVRIIGTEDEVRRAFRQARDEIGMHVVQFLRQFAEV